MKAFLFILFTALSIACYGQNEISDSIKKSEDIKPVWEYKPFDRSQSKKPLDPTNNINYNSTDEGLSHESKDSLMKRLNIYLLPEYVGPGDKTGVVIPTTFILENNYSYQALYRLSDRAWLFTNSERRVYPIMGGVSNISATLSYQLSDQWIISGGPYISKYAINNSHFHDAGVNGQLKFIAHDRIRLNAFGTYSTRGKKNDIGSRYSGMYPQSGYGGTVEFKINEKFGVETGIMRQLDPLSGKWKNIPIINPVFYVK